MWPDAAQECKTERKLGVESDIEITLFDLAATSLGTKGPMPGMTNWKHILFGVKGPLGSDDGSGVPNILPKKVKERLMADLKSFSGNLTLNYTPAAK